MNIKNRGRSVWAVLPALAAALLFALAQPALAAEPLSGVVNVNIASVEELVLLPGIGESRAMAIIALRENKGGFDSVDDLVEVKGIGDAMLAKLRPYLSLEGKTTAVVLQDEEGRLWRMEEEALARRANPTQKLSRLSSHMAYRFGWYSFYPTTDVYDGS